MNSFYIPSYLKDLKRIKDLWIKRHGMEQSKTGFEIQLCADEELEIAKIYKLLLQLKTQEEQVKEYMIKQANDFSYTILIDQWVTMWLKGLKFTLCYCLKELEWGVGGESSPTRILLTKKVCFKYNSPCGIFQLILTDESTCRTRQSF